MKRFLIAIAMAFAGAAFAQGTSPTGLWKTIDDETGQAKSLVRITESGGVLTGKIEKIFDPSKQDSRCGKCEGADKDQPVMGLTIIRGDEILDPNNGKLYKLKLKTIDNGAKLEVRGYMGAPMFGRTQTWLRAE